MLQLAKVKSLKPIAKQLEKVNRSIINFFPRLFVRYRDNQVHCVSFMCMGAGVIIVTSES